MFLSTILDLLLTALVPLFFSIWRGWMIEQMRVMWLFLFLTNGRQFMWGLILQMRNMNSRRWKSWWYFVWIVVRTCRASAFDVVLCNLRLVRLLMLTLFTTKSIYYGHMASKPNSDDLISRFLRYPNKHLWDVLENQIWSMKAPPHYSLDFKGLQHRFSSHSCQCPYCPPQSKLLALRRPNPNLWTSKQTKLLCFLNPLFQYVTHW